MVPMTPDTLDTDRLQEILCCDSFEGVSDENFPYSPEGLLIRSGLILLWSLSENSPQTVIDMVIRQVGEHLDYLTSLGMIPHEDIVEAFTIINGTTTGTLSDHDEATFNSIITQLQ